MDAFQLWMYGFFKGGQTDFTIGLIFLSHGQKTLLCTNTMN